MPDRRSLGTLFRYELKMLLRDRRTLFFSVALPLILLPAMIFIIRFAEERADERREARTYQYAVAGTEPALARALIAEALERPADEAADGGQDGEGVATPDRFREVEPADADSALSAGEIAFLVVAYSPTEVRAMRDSAGPAVPLLRIRYRGNSDLSGTAASELRTRLDALRMERRHAAYRDAGLPVDPSEVARVELRAAATPERESGALLALWLTPLLVMLMLSGGSVVAADAISGEKERGTLETLLTTSIRRSEIVAAKQLLIIAVGIAITVINVANLALYLGLGLFELPERFVISVPPLTLLLLLVLFLPLTVLISSVLLMLSGYSKSYKEYQIYFFPVMIVFALPSAAAVLPGLELASVISVVPLANVSVAVREVMVGEYDWPFLALTVLSTTVVAGWLARLTERTLSTERLITAAEMDEADLRGGPALFPRRVLRWFGVLWVVFFLSSLWFVGEFGVRGQVTYNVVGLFLGTSLLMIWRYRLDPRRALALRMPRAGVWPGVLLAAPSAFLVGIGLAELGQTVFPVPEEMLEAFGQFMLPEGMPLWQIVFFLAVLPGICEEVAFRGVLLHGLRRRFRPVALALVVGLIFGVFHFELFRLVPTTYLGGLLAGVTLATGSIFPAMLWHALNNAIALVPAHLGWWSPETAVPGWLFLAATVGLAAGLGLIWANRTPYPGLRATGNGSRGAPAAEAESRPREGAPAGG